MKRFAVALLAAAAVIAWGVDAARADVGPLEYSGSAVCDADGMQLQLDIKNVSGVTQSIVVQKISNGSVVNTQYNVTAGATVSPAFDLPHYFQMTFKVFLGTSSIGTPDLEFGPRTSTDQANCDLPLPPTRTDIEFEVTAQCDDTTADYTVNVDNLGSDEIEVTWLDANGVPHPDVVDSAEVPVLFSTPLGDRTEVWAEDLWGRLLFSSGDLVADDAGCPRPAQHDFRTTIEVRCEDDGSLGLAFDIVNAGDYREFYAWEWETQSDSDSSGLHSVEPGENDSAVVPFAAGESVTAAITDGHSFSPTDLATFEGLIEESACDEDGSGGSGGALPDSGGTPPVLLAVALLAAGLVLTAASRRRTNIRY